MINYQRTVKFSTVIVDVGTDELTLIVSGLKTTAGAPAATAGVYRPAAIIQNIASGIAYINTGTTASPVWASLETSASGFSLPVAETDATTITGTSFALTFSTLTSGIGENLIGPGATLLVGGKIRQVNLGAATTGTADNIVGTGVYTGLTGVRILTMNAATVGLIDVLSATGLTSGILQQLTGGGANMSAGGIVQNIVMGAATVGAGQIITTTGVYTGVGVRRVVANSATAGVIDMMSGTGITSGIISQAIAAQVTMTTGRYYSANDGANEVFGIGANGHIHSTASADGPAIAVSTPNGISAAALTAGATDTCGVITTTGTQDGSGDTVLQVTFGKTYTTAPKAVLLFPLNSSGSKVSTTTLVRPYISARSATTFDITIPEDSAAGATPSFCYVVIA